MILVTGATGQFGSQAIDHLLDKGVNPSDIAALVRNGTRAESLRQKGIDVRIGDYTEYESLMKAFKNVDKLLLVSSNDRQAVENRTAHHINAITAAKEAGIQHIIYTSFVRKSNFEESSIAAFQDSHVQSEIFLKQSGVAYTILQNGIYMEMIPLFAGDKVIEKGMILFPAAEGKASYVLRSELAEAAAYVLITEAHENKTYTLTNLQSVSFNEIAADLSNVIFREIKYQSPSYEEFEKILKQFNVPDLYINMFVMWAKAVEQDAMDVNDQTLAKFLGRTPATVLTFLRQFYS